MPKLFGRNFTRRQLLERVGDISQVMHARRAELSEGFERGADLIEVFNASGFSFSVLPGRALDIASAHYKGQSLCFRSGPGDVGPAFYEAEGFAWGRGWFGGLVTSCGLNFVGHPEVDPEEENAEMPLHGRLSYIPAKNVGISAGWEGEDYVLKIRGQMRQAEVFAENLELTREITTVLGENRVRICDRIENLAADRSPLMFVYHCNPGFPLSGYCRNGSTFNDHPENVEKLECLRAMEADMCAELGITVVPPSLDAASDAGKAAAAAATSLFAASSAGDGAAVPNALEFD